MKKLNKILILVLSLLIIGIILSVFLSHKKEDILKSNNNETYQFNFTYLNKAVNLSKIISESNPLNIATGCDSIFAFLYLNTTKQGNTTYYDVSIITNQDLVRDMITQIKPSYLPSFNQEEINFYYFNKTSHRFEIDSQEKISDFINISNLCPIEIPPKHVTITANFSEPIGYIDENGNLQKY
ncbi:MAG: hypothetical protein PHH54_07360 [Candidatus Nanoarchaeia archaeon]|nr:hypothetical protein [Candidatus Nanoarchaeia archaeon]MDD5741773.1 hypothetical protein [Candidatus Nanoarchaeia archaeon]